jgi:hypothetical protein
MRQIFTFANLGIADKPEPEAVVEKLLRSRKQKALSVSLKKKLKPNPQRNVNRTQNSKNDFQT